MFLEPEGNNAAREVQPRIKLEAVKLVRDRGVAVVADLARVSLKIAASRLYSGAGRRGTF